MMDGRRKYFQAIIDTLEEEKFFATTHISKKIMINCLIKAMDHNLDTKGDYQLDEQDMLNVYQSAFETNISNDITDLLQKGLIEITDVDPNGELIYGITEAGQKELEPKGTVISAKFEQIGSFGPFCLN
jgi:hypothetical protein